MMSFDREKDTPASHRVLLPRREVNRCGFEAKSRSNDLDEEVP